MKRVKLFIVSLVCLFAANTACHAFELPISTNLLPASAKNFIERNFPGRYIAYASIDTDYMDSKYEVCLNDGTEIDFNWDGTLEKIDCHRAVVPQGFVPPAIRHFVRTHFPGAVIVKVDRERYGYDIELSNDIELKFNHQGDFLYYDD